MQKDPKLRKTRTQFTRVLFMRAKPGALPRRRISSKASAQPGLAGSNSLPSEQTAGPFGFKGASIGGDADARRRSGITADSARRRAMALVRTSAPLIQRFRFTSLAQVWPESELQLVQPALTGVAPVSIFKNSGHHSLRVQGGNNLQKAASKSETGATFVLRDTTSCHGQFPRRTIGFVDLLRGFGIVDDFFVGWISFELLAGAD
jgi:hypothetical protein